MMAWLLGAAPIVRATLGREHGVDLTAQLGRLRSIEDVSRLMASLGHEPLLEAVPELIARRGGEASDTAFAVARAGDFPWFAVAGSGSDRLARRLARRLAVRGRVAGVLGLDAEERTLVVAIAVDGVPSLELALDAPAFATVSCLARLAGTGPGGALAYAARAADALSGEAVGHRFFREFKATLDRMADGMPTALRGDDRRSLALLQLTRVLFLYFVQAKGWLAGRDRFLSEQVDRCLAGGRQLHRDLLRPLFFGTLNRAPADRTRGAAGFGSIPFLNGGLFEPHPLERHLRGDIPNALWREAFDRLFERFHFVVTEQGGGGIAPDMLGRVFEGVMAPDVRRASGTYYTPAALVRSMIDSALVALAAGRLGCDESAAERRLRDRDPAIVSVLTELSLLDPAVGSGAFLLGALDRLASLTAPDGRPTPSDRRRILQRNLFGVDRSAAAVRLTELRLWLAVIADDGADRPERVEPLPNLDCLVRQGDSLFEPVGGVRLPTADPALADAVAGLRQRLVSATGPAKRELARALRLAECRAAEASLRAGEADARARVAECVLAARCRNLFGERRGMDRELAAQLTQARADLRALRGARRTLTRDRELPWFHYQSHFADVFATGGFDLVVGNPPWLRAEQIPAEMRQRLAGRYRWWRRSGTAYGNRPDLAVAFLERAVELAAPGAVVAMLVPAKLATAGYGAAARHALAASTTLIHVVDLTGQPDAAFDATVYPLAVVARKASPCEGHRVRTTLPPSSSSGMPQSGLRGGGPWVLTADRAVERPPPARARASLAGRTVHLPPRRQDRRQPRVSRSVRRRRASVAPLGGARPGRPAVHGARASAPPLDPWRRRCAASQTPSAGRRPPRSIRASLASSRGLRGRSAVDTLPDARGHPRPSGRVAGPRATAHRMRPHRPTRRAEGSAQYLLRRADPDRRNGGTRGRVAQLDLDSRGGVERRRSRREWIPSLLRDDRRPAPTSSRGHGRSRALRYRARRPPGRGRAGGPR